MLVPLVTNHLTVEESELTHFKVDPFQTKVLETRVQITSNCMWRIVLAKEGNSGDPPFVLVGSKQHPQKPDYSTQNIDNLLIDFTNTRNYPVHVRGFVSTHNSNCNISSVKYLFCFSLDSVSTCGWSIGPTIWSLEPTMSNTLKLLPSPKLVQEHGSFLKLEAKTGLETVVKWGQIFYGVVKAAMFSCAFE